MSSQNISSIDNCLIYSTGTFLAPGIIFIIWLMIKLILVNYDVNNANITIQICTQVVYILAYMLSLTTPEVAIIGLIYWNFLHKST